METDNKFDGKHYITAKVIIPADNFAKEMLGKSPTTLKLTDFIRDNASLMEFVYGSTRIVSEKELFQPDTFVMLDMISKKVQAIKEDTDYLTRKVTTEVLNQMLAKPKPWYKRILGL